MLFKCFSNAKSPYKTTYQAITIEKFKKQTKKQIIFVSSQSDIFDSAVKNMPKYLVYIINQFIFALFLITHRKNI